MKRILVIIALLVLSIDVISQQLSTEARLDTIQYNLFRFHKQYKTGTYITLCGSGFIVAGALLASKRYKSSYAIEQNRINSIQLICIGTITSMVGYIIQVDAHRFIGYAGIDRMGVVYKL